MGSELRSVTRPSSMATSSSSDSTDSHALGEAEADAVGLLGEEDSVGLPVVLLLVDDPRSDAPSVIFTPQRVHVVDGEPAARLLGIPAVDGQADLHLVSREP